MTPSMSFRAPSIGSSCSVCGQTDVRALCTTRLSNGDVVVVCGTHELMHRRSRKIAANVRELDELVCDRRAHADRRREEIDELGAQLSAAFRSERRASGDRRR